MHMRAKLCIYVCQVMYMCARSNMCARPCTCVLRHVYMCYGYQFCACFYNTSFRFCNCFDGVVSFVFHFFPLKCKCNLHQPKKNAVKINNYLLYHKNNYYIMILFKQFYYIRLYFTVFLLARSNTRDIPFSNILISKKQFLCNK